jgi:hypothetical protein
MKLNNPAFLNIAKIISIFFLFLIFALHYLSIPLWDSDFWWHIANGRYIVTSGSLPEQDPFCFTSSLKENKNPFPEWENFILKQYWLSQIIFYFIYDSFGTAGIIILRTLLLLLTLVIIFWRLQRWSVNLPLSFIFLSIVFITSLMFTGERPVLFTIIFCVLTFLLIEDFRDRKSKCIFLLIPLMLLWSNMHGGFIIGVMVISLFMLGEGINILLKKSVFTKQEIFTFYSALVLAIGVSLINPTGWDAFYITVNIPFKFKPIHENIQEYYSLYYTFMFKVHSLPYSYVFLALMFPIIVLLRRRNIELSHIMLLGFLLVPSLLARRFIIFYVVTAAMILGKEINIILNDLFRKKLSPVSIRKIMIMLTLTASLSAILYSVRYIYDYDKPTFDVAKTSYTPVDAVTFIENNKIWGNMFNDHGYGGYLSWRLYPTHKTFVDTRSLNILVKMEYAWIINTLEYDDINAENSSVSQKPLWELLFNHYNVTYVFLPVVNQFSQINPIILALTESKNWTPVYTDQMSAIFMKNIPQNSDLIKEKRIPKEEIYNTIIFQSAKNALQNEVNPRSLVSLGDIFYRMKRLKDALAAYRYALDRMPGNTVILDKITQIENDLKQQKANNKEESL